MYTPTSKPQLNALSPAESAALLEADQIEAAVAILKQGGLVAFPTETVYGLGADAENPEALDRLYTVKGRPKGHPVIVHLAEARQLSDWAEEVPAMAWQLAQAFWPGPLTLILKRSQRVPDTVTGGQETVGLRVPSHPVALQLLRAFGGGVAAPSANRFGRLSPTRAAHVQADLGDDVQLILDGGACAVGVESTIVAFREGHPVILRPGMITAEQIEAALQSDFKSDDLKSGWLNSAGSGSTSPKTESDPIDQKAISSQPETMVIRAPGTLASHYAPRTPLSLVSSRQLAALNASDFPNRKTIGVLAWQAQPQGLAGISNLIWVGLDNSPEIVARELYVQLRNLDQRGLDEIWVESAPAEGAWAAVADRLRRAAYRDSSK